MDWLEQQLAELALTPDLEIGTLEDRIMALRTAFADAETVFGMVAEPAHVETKRTRILAILETWEATVEPQLATKMISLFRNGPPEKRRVKIKTPLDREIAKLLRCKDVTTAGPLPLTGPIRVWHPLADFDRSPLLDFRSVAMIEVLREAGEVIAYVLRTTRGVSKWSLIGDASTAADRVLLVRFADRELVDETFEELGGDEPVEMVTHANATVVVLKSSDGNAKVYGGYTNSGVLAVAVIRIS